MSYTYLNNGYSNFVLSLLLLFPVVINTVKIIGNLILLILVLLGIYVLLTERKSPFKIPELKLFSWVTFIYFLVMLFSIIQNEGFVDDLYHLGRKAHFALAPLIALAIYRVKLPFDKLLLNIKIGLIIIGTIVIYQNFGGIQRPSGMYNANVFGDLVLVMVFFSLINLFNEKRFTRVLTLISSSLGIYAVILTQNRGTFLAMIVLSILYLVLIIKKHFVNDTKKKFISIVILIIIFCLLLTNVELLKRIDATTLEITSWYNQIPKGITSSSGLRFEMWLGSIEAIKESPFLGHGYRNANAVVSEYVDKEVQRIVFNFTHLHNEYITNLVSAGVIGLISVLALLLLPLKVFMRNISNEEAYIYSAMGVILCVSYALIGMTHIAFGEEHVNAFYVFFLAILLPKVIRKENLAFSN